MGLYSVNNRLAGTQQALSTTFKTQISLTAATASLRRARVWEVQLAADAAPNATDCQIVCDVSRQTAAGTGTSATPVPLDPANAACDTVALVNLTVEPTVTAASSLLAMAANQRAQQFWRAFGADQCLIIPATNLAGVALRALSPTYAAAVLGEMYVEDI